MRIIGIRHRVKKTAQGEARPTQVVIQTGDERKNFDLPTETDELDFVLGRFPIRYRKAVESDDIKSFFSHQLKTKKLKKEDNPFDHPKNLLLKVGEDTFRVTEIPEIFEGLRGGDKVVMSLGGSGDRLAFALSRQGDEIGASVFRLPPFELNSKRGEDSKDDDATLLVEIFLANPELFYKVGVRDREYIKLKEVYFNRSEAMSQRIACEQRLRSRYIGKVFLSEEGKYPEGLIEDGFDKLKASDAILSGLLEEEKLRNKDLKSTIEGLPVYNMIFKKVKGVGPAIAAGVITAVGDIRRFSSEAKLKKFLGVHVDEKGRFPRRRSGEVANWHPKGRQALYLLGDQFVYQADSEWGVKLREYKKKLREKHPVVECTACVVPWEECRKGEADAFSGKHTRKYTDQHIHRMAVWRTLSKFVESLYRDWTALEDNPKKEERAA